MQQASSQSCRDSDWCVFRIRTWHHDVRTKMCPSCYISCSDVLLLCFPDFIWLRTGGSLFQNTVQSTPPLFFRENFTSFCFLSLQTEIEIPVITPEIRAVSVFVFVTSSKNLVWDFWPDFLWAHWAAVYYRNDKGSWITPPHAPPCSLWQTAATVNTLPSHPDLHGPLKRGPGCTLLGVKMMKDADKSRMLWLARVERKKWWLWLLVGMAGVYVLFCVWM